VQTANLHCVDRRQLRIMPDGIIIIIIIIIFEHPHVKAVSVAKKNSPVKIGPRNGGFSEIKGPNIKYSHRDPQKALPCPE